MLERTDHEEGRWHLIAAESKRWARVKVIETVIAEIESGLDRRGWDPDQALQDEQVAG